MECVRSRPSANQRTKGVPARAVVVSLKTNVLKEFLLELSQGCLPQSQCHAIVLKEFLLELLLFLTEMCKKSLSQGCLPQSQCHAIVTQRLKKTNADPSEGKELQVDLQPDFYVKRSGKTDLSLTCCIF